MKSATLLSTMNGPDALSMPDMILIRLQKFVSWRLALVLWLTSPAVQVHTGVGSSGLMSGLAHPFSGLDHILAVVAAGVLG